MVQHCCRWYMTRMRQCQTFDNKCLHYDGVYEDLGHRLHYTHNAIDTSTMTINDDDDGT